MGTESLFYLSDQVCSPFCMPKYLQCNVEGEQSVSQITFSITKNIGLSPVLKNFIRFIGSLYANIFTC
jgi:hypothetical protein